VQPKSVPAQQQRFVTLLDQNDYRKAGQALDAHLAAGGRRTPSVLEARGLIHLLFDELPQAIEAFTLALFQRRDANVLAYRGWAYLGQKAMGLAEADFEEALQLQEGQLEALCGRGMARARQGKPAGALADVETVLRRGPRTERRLFRCACIHARCLEKPAAARRFGEAYTQQERALALLREALELVPKEDRQAYWRNYCLKDPDLASLHGSTEWLALTRSYAR
jgi:tetratricopeptide (TPR) repeat protein